MRPLRTLLALFLLGIAASGAAHAQTSPVVGTWGTTLNPGKATVIYVTLVMAPSGQFTEHWMDRLGISLDLVGTYQFDPAKRLLTFLVTDYSPKAACTPGVAIGCTAVLAPEAQALIGKQIVDQVQFPNTNFMSATGPDGVLTAWTRLG